MWDSSFMADFDNVPDINENFDTIKTLLNSIRAQGILNTSDVDKLLSGINTKLEKINTEEDIDLIKIFLSELKQTLDERHTVLVSKFGAIESLFTNLLKNTSEMLKSSEVKELFDIVATNLSVFSREVVSQKESLTDITLRIDALRSDDTDKKDIIKNIALLKPDLERLNNGFDSIVLSLNDNFKAIIKTITTIDKTEHLDKFADSLTGIDMSVNTVLSALQMLDKKSEQVDETLKQVASKEDLSSTNKRIVELTAQTNELSHSVSNLSDSYLRLDNLSEKINASVNIIASLKSVLEDTDDNNTKLLLEKLEVLSNEIQSVKDEAQFEELRLTLQDVLKYVSEISSTLDKRVLSTFESVIANALNDNNQKTFALAEANASRIMNELASNAESFSSKINEVKTSLANLSERSFGSVFEGITNLKTLISQVDDNSVSANNAIFSSITDRLSVFESTLRDSLELQEKTVTLSSEKLVEHIESIKNLSSVLDYKMDASVVENANIKASFADLQKVVKDVLALDFVTVVKDFRVDLYASKQEIVNTLENSSTALSEKFTEELYSKYELLLNKLDLVEDEVKKVQLNTLSSLGATLENISSAIVDIRSYVSETSTTDFVAIENGITKLLETVKENKLDYVEAVRDIVNAKTTEATDELKNELKYSYSKLLEIRDAYDELKDLVIVNHQDSSGKITTAIVAAESLKTDFETKLTNLRAQLFDRITEFKQEFSCENADKISELKFSVENMYTKNSTEIITLVGDLKALVNKLQSESAADRNDIVEKINEGLVALKDYINLQNENLSNSLSDKVDVILADFSDVKNTISTLDENLDADLTRQLSILESNFEALVSQIAILFEKSDRSLAEKINNEFEQVSENVQNILTDKLEEFKSKLENTFDNLGEKSKEQADFIQNKVENLNSALKEAVLAQTEENIKQLDAITEKLANILDDKAEQATADYVALNESLNKFTIENKENNTALISNFRAQLDDIAKYVQSVLDAQTEDFDTKQADLSLQITNSSTAILEKVDGVSDMGLSVRNDIELLAQSVGANKAQLLDLEETAKAITEQIDLTKQNLKTCSDELLAFMQEGLKAVDKSVEKETDIIIAEIIEQFDLLKKSQADDIINLTSKIEDIISSQIYSNIEDLKGYLDVKTDYSLMDSKLDNLKIELVSSVESILSGMNKMLETGVFNNAISDFKLANEVLLNNAIEGINDKIDTFVSDNLAVISEGLNSGTKSIEDKLALFDKKFIETVVDKYEEIKLMVNNYNSSFDTIENHFTKIIADFEASRSSTNEKLDELTREIKDLGSSFEGLKNQISSKSFDEAFQASINKQIGDLENLIKEQMGYVEDINALCETNLPDVTEMNVLLKGSLFETVKDFSEKLEAVDVEAVMQSELKQFKSDIITQFINVFNQVSFVAEQEEILDFIQEKHDELITILSHIVTTTEDISNIKADIAMINDKINSIISSEGDVDYIYSLQDLESDIANLRLALGEMNSEEFSSLVQSTNDIYALVETIKTELPTKNDFDAMAEDIVSISTRTNKLILATDESYKALQDNLQEFKLVINDLDERTRNFSQEAGLDRIDSKLNALNSMMQNGAKTNQVFNQVFEYLAEWVDNASTQINLISDKVETLDDISQIKDMLVEIKSGTDENEGEELVEALGSVFNKQAKKISTIEKKLDTIIVETTMNKVDLSPIEKTLNKYFTAMEEKFNSQQDRIKQLETKLENAMSLLGNKETALLTKKVGGMDKQIAKLNKSIEKLTSHVAEK